MELISSIPGWVWVLIIFLGLMFLYGIFNRRWLEDEAREKARAAEAAKPPAPDAPHAPVQAASLRPPPQADKVDEKDDKEHEADFGETFD